jgi:hypothetical protein
MTNSERIQVLDERLRKGYETFDGFILTERERAQSESDAAGSVAVGGGGAAGGAGSANQPQTLPAETGTGGPLIASQPSSSARAAEETFAPPEDIPSGRDDDVVARQIRELAMSEPDPELREAIWDEYRKYTGISTGDQQ